MNQSGPGFPRTLFISASHTFDRQNRRRQPMLVCCAAVLTVAISLAGNPSACQQEPAVTLDANQRIEREISGGEAHAYRVTLAAGEFLRAVVEQRGVNLLLTLKGPDGAKMADLDSPNGAEGPEPVSLVAEVAGAYRIEVRPWQSAAPKGSYEIRVVERRAATARDKDCVTADRAFAAASLLIAQGTADALRQGLEQYKKVLQLRQDLQDRAQEALTLNVIGYVHSRLGEYQQALDGYRRALALYQAAGDRAGQAQALYSLGAAYDHLGEPRQALDVYRQALTLYQQLGEHSMEAAVLGNLGVVHSGLGEQEKALELFQRALALKQAAREPYGEATLLNNIGLVQSYLGERQQALETYQRALSLCRALNNLSGESTALNNIGTLYGELGDQAKQLEMLEEVLRIKHQRGNSVEEAIALNNIGVAYGKLREYRQALDYYKRALPLSRGARATEAVLLTNIGTNYSDQGEYRQALEFFERALALQLKAGDRRAEAVTRASQGFAHFRLGELPQAMECLNRALALQQAVRDRGGEALTRYNLALAHRALNQLTEARAHIESARALVETLRGKVASQGLRTSYLASSQKYYELEIDLLMRLAAARPAENASENYAAAALQISERARARSLLELLAEARADIRQGVAADLLDRERALQRMLDAKAAAQTQLLNGRHTAEQAAAAAKEIGALVTEYEQLQAQIRRASPRYAALTQPAPLTVSEIQRDLLGEGTMLLEYALGEEQSWLWAVTPSSLKSYALPKRADIEAAARRARELLIARNQSPPGETPAQRYSRIEQADADYPQAAAALSRLLLGPVASQLENKRLLIVADGLLQYVPFAALPATAGEGKKEGPSQKPQSAIRNPAPILIVEHEIIILPSASVLAVLRRENTNRKAASKTLAVLADPVFGPDDSRLAPVNGANTMRAGESNFVRLRFSRTEADAIAALAPGGGTLKALDFAASRETATSPALGEYRIVHFATHAVINQQHPELSGIVLSQVNEQGLPLNGLLRLHEIYNLRLSAELVVLSACETALGQEVRGEGMIGLTRGFMYAGAPRVAASLWRTDDRAAAELMKRFYQRMLGEGMTAAAALRAAQVSLLQDKRWETPYYWAAFTLQGEWK